MQENTTYIEESVLRKTEQPVSGEIVFIEDEKYYKISNYDVMPSFLMSIVSDSDLWMFISSNGSLTAGRKNPDHALFPYYTDDRIHDSQNVTGSKTIVFVQKDDKTFLWEPFSSSSYEIYNTQRNIYKSILGNKVIFEEINLDLSIGYQYSWQNCDRFGFIRKSKIINNSHETAVINILDGIQNILPYGVDRKFQLEYSTLLDGYKKNELIDEVGLGLYTLSSLPTDKAEPNESLKTTIVWSVGLNNAKILLSSQQVNSFIHRKPLTQEHSVNARRGAYLLQSEFELALGEYKEWFIAADLNKDQNETAEIYSLLVSNNKLKQLIEEEVAKDSNALNLKIANSDASQITNDQLVASRHVSNVLFNIMRGGIFDNNYLIEKNDFCLFVKKINSSLLESHASFFNELPDHIDFTELGDKVKVLQDIKLEKIYHEYLPLTFSRRHGDPSRPWNLFSIDIKDDHGNKVLNYQGNWRDVFQNWEALALSFPEYIENMIAKFVNASTADGYNPYKLTRESFDWETIDPEDTWSYIGYWGDHQIIYLLKLLELSSKYHPGILQSYFTKEIFAYANVPYKIKAYDEIVKDPHNTVEFDFKLDEEIRERVKQAGENGKYIWNNDKEIYHVNLTEKLLVSMLVKFTNFVPEAGIWMNSQRPEWNDANNALVGFGASMVTLYYLRRYLAFIPELLVDFKTEQINISEEVSELFLEIQNIFTDFKGKLNSSMSDAERREIVDRLGHAGSIHRQKIYSNGFSGGKQTLSVSSIKLFCELGLKYIDHSIAANKREDSLYHSYNLIKFSGKDEIKIRHLYEMLEGQVSVLSSGYLSPEESITLLDALKKSKLYRKDQNSYLLYPERKLPGFMEKNIIPKELLEHSGTLREMIEVKDKSIITKDINGKIHFNCNLRNAGYLKAALREKGLDEKEQEIILNIYEFVFDHQSFTGRSGTFYKYEGLGSIYWHMVSKLLLAVQETFNKAEELHLDDSILEKLKNHYYEIREGIGIHKSPELYGAFPTDPYSHTPANMGAQQPGMTGQVKEDIISRFGELGVYVVDGKICFKPGLLLKDEFLVKSQVFKYYDINGRQQTLMLNPEMLAFTLCQVPVVYIISKTAKVILTKIDGMEEEIDGSVIGKSLSKMIFQRKNAITRITVLINKFN